MMMRHELIFFKLRGIVNFNVSLRRRKEPLSHEDRHEEASSYCLQMFQPLQQHSKNKTMPD